MDVETADKWADGQPDEWTDGETHCTNQNDAPGFYLRNLWDWIFSLDKFLGKKSKQFLGKKSEQFLGKKSEQFLGRKVTSKSLDQNKCKQNKVDSVCYCQVYFVYIVYIVPSQYKTRSALAITSMNWGVKIPNFSYPISNDDEDTSQVPIF